MRLPLVATVLWLSAILHGGPATCNLWKNEEPPAPSGAPAPAPAQTPTQTHPMGWLWDDAMVAMPDPPRRIPHRPLRYQRPPPQGGSIDFPKPRPRIGDCPALFTAAKRSAARNPEEAWRYREAWLCFQGSPGRLRQARASDWAALRRILVHLEGAPEAQEARLADQPELSQTPIWRRPAAGGVEFRLERYLDDPVFHEAILDMFGEPKVADQLFIDLYAEAAMAAGLARVPVGLRTPAMERAWARRVFVVERALNGPPGTLLRRHRVQDLEALRALLAKQ